LAHLVVDRVAGVDVAGERARYGGRVEGVEQLLDHGGELLRGGAEVAPLALVVGAHPVPLELGECVLHPRAGGGAGEPGARAATDGGQCAALVGEGGAEEAGVGLDVPGVHERGSGVVRLGCPLVLLQRAEEGAGQLGDVADVVGPGGDGVPQRSVGGRGETLTCGGHRGGGEVGVRRVGGDAVVVGGAVDDRLDDVELEADEVARADGGAVDVNGAARDRRQEAAHGGEVEPGQVPCGAGRGVGRGPGGGGGVGLGGGGPVLGLCGGRRLQLLDPRVGQHRDVGGDDHLEGVAQDGVAAVEQAV